jgi:diguanylate cyclase (GGDEF)-like protein
VQDQPLLIVLIAALIINGILVIAAVAWSRRHPDATLVSASRGTGRGVGADPGSRASRPILGSYIDPEAPRERWAADGLDDEASVSPAMSTAMSTMTAMSADVPAETEAAREASALEPDSMGIPATEPEPVDPETGLVRSPAWLRTLELEQSRTVRYGRPSTVVVFELDGLDRLVERLGADAADRLIPAVAKSLDANTRDSDRLARLAPGRFGTVLTETDEVRAINHIERIRAATDLWLEAGAVALRLAIGWAQLTPNRSLDDTVQLALERMNADRRATRPRTTRKAGAVTVHSPSNRPPASAIPA